VVEIGEKIKKFREMRGLTQSQLAEAANVDSNTVSRWERGDLRIKADKIAPIAAALNCSTDDLLKEENEAPQTRRRSKAAEDAEIIIIELLKKNPDLAVSFRNVRSNWEQLSDKDIEALALGLQWSLGVADARIDEKLKTVSRDGEL
jgi:transcriptional regulator with XRE-family HTH domain